MDLFYLIGFILLVIILLKISDLQNKLEHIEKLLKQKTVNSGKEALSTKPTKAEDREVLTIGQKLEAQKSLHKVVPTEEKEPPEKKVQLQPKVSHETKIIQEQKSITAPKVLEKTPLEKYFEEINWEEFLFGNIILKVAIVAFILGIGLFLKYSIDRDWIPVWGRVLIGIMVGISMLLGGIKMINNKHKLFSEGLFGGGIAVLYLSTFAAFAFEGFKFIDVNFAFVAMIGITILAGVISIRFDAKSTAIFGLIGGFATPFLLSSGSGNYVGLLTYMLILNLGVLYISLYKKWSLLTWMAFAITALTQLATVGRTVESFVPLLMLLGLFFVIYSLVPFIREIKEKKEHLANPSVFLFWANFIVAILSFLALFEHYEIELLYYAGVTVVLAAYLLSYAMVLSRKNVLYKNLFYIVLAQAIALLLVTPAFIFSGASLSIVWAIESLMLLWIATKSEEKTYGLFGLFGFVITILRYLGFDIFGQLTYSFYENGKVSMAYIGQVTLTSFFVIGSLFAGYKLLEKSSLNFEYISNKVVSLVLFMVSFLGAYIMLTYISTMLFDLIYDLNVFTISSILIIGLFAFLFSRSEYSKSFNHIYYLFMGLLMFEFIDNISHIGGENILVSLLSFLAFIGVGGFIYHIAFKESERKIANYKLSEVMLSSAIGLLFIFLNVEVYHVVKLFDATATKFAITLLWIFFGIALFVYAILKDRKISKMTGTVLILLAILKAFFVDLANLDSIYRIVLFLILGTILFGLSYFYQSKQSSNKASIEEEE